jgi:ABC-2 type transport system ATP-binding protein
MSSHNLAEVEKLCDHIGIIRAGQLVAVETLSTLRQKRIQVVKAYFYGDPDLQVLKTSGIEDFEKLAGNGVSFKVKGDITPVLREISKFSLHDIEITHASLEEIFMEYYK